MSMFFMGMIRDAWNNSKYYTDFFQLWLGNHGKNLMNAWNPDENFDSEIPALIRFLPWLPSQSWKKSV